MVAPSAAFFFFFSKFLATMAKFMVFFLSSRNSLVCYDSLAGKHARQGLVRLKVVQVLGDGFTGGLAPPSAVWLSPPGGRGAGQRSSLVAVPKILGVSSGLGLLKVLLIMFRAFLCVSSRVLLRTSILTSFTALSMSAR